MVDRYFAAASATQRVLLAITAPVFIAFLIVLLSLLTNIALRKLQRAARRRALVWRWATPST